MVAPNNFFIMDLIETFHISRKWAFFGLLSHAFFPLPIHLLRENFDFECTNIIKHQFVLKSKKKKEFTIHKLNTFHQNSPHHRDIILIERVKP